MVQKSINMIFMGEDGLTIAVMIQSVMIQYVMLVSVGGWELQIASSCQVTERQISQTSEQRHQAPQHEGPNTHALHLTEQVKKHL